MLVADVVAGDQVAHHLAQAGEVVLGLAHRLAARQAELAQAVAQRHERLLVELAGEVERAVEKDLGLADALEERVELAGDLRRVEPARRGDELAPARFQERAGDRRLGDGDLELGMHRRIGRRVEERGEQAVDLGARQLLGVVGAGGERHRPNRGVAAHSSVIRTSPGSLCRSMTRQSPHICSRSAARPWNIE